MPSILMFGPNQLETKNFMAIKQHIVSPYARENGPEEQEFYKVGTIFQKYAGYLGDGYYLGNIRTNGVELDALLITTKHILGLEFKNYGGKGKQLDIKANSWEIYDCNGNRVLDEYGNPLSVKGGSYSEPIGQAKANRPSLLKSINMCLNKTVSSRDLSYAIVFNNELKIRSKNVDIPEWLHITDIEHLDTMLKNLAGKSNIQLKESEINTFFEFLGVCAADFVDSYDVLDNLCNNGFLRQAENMMDNKKMDDQRVKLIKIRALVGSAFQINERCNYFISRDNERYCRLNRVMEYKLDTAKQTVIMNPNIPGIKNYGLYVDAAYYELIEPEPMVVKLLEKYRQASASLGFVELWNRLRELKNRYEKDLQNRRVNAINDSTGNICYLHNNQVKLLFALLWVVAIIFIAGDVMRNLYGKFPKVAGYGSYIIYASLIVLYVSFCTISFANNRFLEKISEFLPWRGYKTPVIGQDMIMVYGSYVQMAKHKIISTGLLLLVLIASNVVLLKLCSMESLLNFHPSVRMILNNIADVFPLACIVLCLFWECQFVLRVIQNKGKFGVNGLYISGMQAGLPLVKYFMKNCLYLFKASIILSVIGVLPYFVNYVISVFF
jgi:hypothetical protein